MHFLSSINEVAAGPHYVIAKGLNDSSFLMAYICLRIYIKNLRSTDIKLHFLLCFFGIGFLLDNYKFFFFKPYEFKAITKNII